MKEYVPVWETTKGMEAIPVTYSGKLVKI